jgi:hypothetical protein
VAVGGVKAKGVRKIGRATPFFREQRSRGRTPMTQIGADRLLGGIRGNPRPRQATPLL